MTARNGRVKNRVDHHEPARGSQRAADPAQGPRGEPRGWSDQQGDPVRPVHGLVDILNASNNGDGQVRLLKARRFVI